MKTEREGILKRTVMGIIRWQEGLLFGLTKKEQELIETFAREQNKPPTNEEIDKWLEGRPHAKGGY